MTTKLHVHRLPVSTTDAELQRLFEGVGRVVNCDVVTDGTTRASRQSDSWRWRRCRRHEEPLTNSTARSWPDE
jgi:hypothetical protein